MKRIMHRIFSVLAALLLFCGVSTALYSTVYGASASLTGTNTVRAGDTITLTLVVSDSGKYALEGTLSYDSSKVTYTGISSSRTGWKAEISGNTIIAYDDNMTNPLGNSTSVLKLTFKVNSSLQPGTSVDIAVKNIVTTTGSSEGNAGNATYSVSIAKPVSTDNNLSGLSVDGYTLSPAFSAGTTTYSIGEVDYSVSSIRVNATKADNDATVSVSGTNLSVGANTVTVTVKAQNGSTKTYKINVTRKQNPNYVAGNNANVSSVSLSSGKLSPQFDASVTGYVVYLPHEDAGTRWEIKGTAQDAKATGVQSGVIESLVEGNNSTKLVCTAEDGTKKTYNVVVVVMPKYSGGEPATWESDNTVQDGNSDKLDNPSDATDDGGFKEVESNHQSNQKSTPIWLILVFVVLSAVAGFGACYLLYSKN
ncbi:MAG: cadherin-like beta sandwich domain-containing protein [Lachnospira sp.]|nr:cadherin-like beta sandwich domain-containing protein [Lachnospira sp.]